MRWIVVKPGRSRRANPLLFLYHWRYEFALLAVVGALVQLGRAVHWALPVLIVLCTAAVVAVWPPARRAVGDRIRSAVVQHRLRSAFRELALTTWAGRTPAILWSSPCPEGLRVHVLCPAGTSADDLREVRESLAAACFAVDLRVERDLRYASVVVLVVVTRVPVS
jgi:hypothetical protein